MSVEECSITWDRSIGKKSVDVEYYALPEEIESKNRLPRMLLAHTIQEIGQGKYLFLIIPWILILRVIQLKIWMVRKYQEVFSKKNGCLLNYKPAISQN